MPLPQPFSTATPAIASYSYTDIAEGTGTIVYYGASEEDSASLSYFLSAVPTLSSQIGTGAISVPATFTKMLDLDFDLSLFNIPQRIKGTGRVIYTNSAKGGTNDAVDTYVILKLRKWDGTTQTELASVQSTTETLGSSGGTLTSKENNLSMTIPETHFNKGETLRLTMEVWGKTNATPFNGQVQLAHDPKDRDDTDYLLDADSSIMEAHIPYMLDV